MDIDKECVYMKACWRDTDNHFEIVFHLNIWITEILDVFSANLIYSFICFVSYLALFDKLYELHIPIQELNKCLVAMA